LRCRNHADNGINNLDEITGFYSDANGVVHGFVAFLPETGSLTLMGFGLAVLGLSCRRGRRKMHAS